MDEPRPDEIATRLKTLERRMETAEAKLSHIKESFIKTLGPRVEMLETKLSHLQERVIYFQEALEGQLPDLWS